MEPTLGQTVVVQSYKHDERLHRIWAKATIIDSNKSQIIVANQRTKVIEANGRFWYTKEPSVTWFYKEHWFNIIGIIRPNGIYYYCNIASPYVIDEEALKYIDYDLDIKVNKDFTYKLLDRKEYKENLKNMHYSEKLQNILESQQELLKKWIEEKTGPFTGGVVEQLYERYSILKPETP
jgi:protein associated with RNAse G/E